MSALVRGRPTGRALVRGRLSALKLASGHGAYGAWAHSARATGALECACTAGALRGRPPALAGALRARGHYGGGRPAVVQGHGHVVPWCDFVLALPWAALASCDLQTRASAGLALGSLGQPWPWPCLGQPWAALALAVLGHAMPCMLVLGLLGTAWALCGPPTRANLAVFRLISPPPAGMAGMNFR